MSTVYIVTQLVRRCNAWEEVIRGVCTTPDQAYKRAQECANLKAGTHASIREYRLDEPYSSTPDCDILIS